MIPFTTTKAMFARRAGRPHHQIGQLGGSPHATAAASRMTESTGEPVQPAHSTMNIVARRWGYPSRRRPGRPSTTASIRSSRFAWQPTIRIRADGMMNEYRLVA
jgi:hypothetical protein